MSQFLTTYKEPFQLLCQIHQEYKLTDISIHWWNSDKLQTITPY